MMENLNGFFEYFAGSGFPITLIVLVLAALCLFLVLMMYVPALTRKIFPKFGYDKYSSYLPFGTVFTDNSMQLTDGSLIRVYRVAGVQTSMQDDATKEKFLDLRAQLFNQIRDPNVVLRFYMVRDAADENTNYEFDQPTLQRIYDKWRGQGLKIFLNNYYIVVSVAGVDARAKLNQYGNYIESILAAYKPVVLKNDSADNMARFFGRILSPISKPAPKRADNNIAKLTTVDDVEFLRDGVIRYISGGEQSFAACLSFKISPDYLDEEFFDSVSTIQTEMITMNGFHIMGAADVESTIRKKRSTADDERRDSTETQISEAQNAMDENLSGNQSLVDYYPLFVLFGATREELQKSVDEFKKIAAQFGISPVVETFASKVSWFAQIPGFNVFPRSFKLLSRAAAISIPMSTQPRGVENSDWGPGPLVVFPTAQGTPYQFQFHVSDKPAAVGHTLTIGPTGGGKTTLFSFLIAQSLRHPKLKAFFFDRNKGAEIFTLAVGGKYITMQGKEKNSDPMAQSFLTHLNPLKMPDTAVNRAFLRRWFAIISGQSDAASADEIARAVSVNFDYLSDKDRMLKNLWESCFSSSGNMRSALKKWVDPLQYGDMFNEASDTLDLHSRLTTFDFTDILQDEVLSPAVISYILHRINNITVSGGNPSLIMIDETAPMLENKMFRDNFITGLQEGRKNRQAYMVAFQRANVLDKLGVGDVVRGQAQTVMFFRNPAADASDYAHWNLNPLEMAFIQGKAYPNLKRAVLLSRPVNGESVILNTELGGLGNLLRLFESGRSSVLLAEELYKMYGNNFVNEYLKKSG
jgi:type IV secretion system protein VirB4